MRHFWFTDENADNIMDDHRGNVRGAIKRAEEYLTEHPECDTVYINEGEEIIECVWR